ncbi:MAG: DNA polymerase I [Thermoanaerobacteraceae bacterium]|nr:DNA polymerase I [Thermoanaerobacteraceae bacterium]
MKKFLVIDGNSLIHRAFYALPLLQNRRGQYTNAVYGFTNMLLKVLDEQQPQYAAVCFDKGKVTFRHDKFQDYKGHRKATPPELRPQFDLVKQVVAALGISTYELEGYEADDLIGSLVTLADQEGFNSLIVTGDRDALQLVSEGTRVLLTRKGISQLELYDLNAIGEKYGLEPAQLIDVKGLMGDASDNIPGVPGIGEKTALKLIKQYGSLEEVLANIDNISGKKLKERLAQHREQARLSKELATIDRDVPVKLDLEECVLAEPDYSRVLKLFKELEFTSLIGRFLKRMEEGDGDNRDLAETAARVISIETAEELTKELEERFDLDRPVAVYLQRDDRTKSVIGIGIANGEACLGCVTGAEKLRAVRDLLSRCSILLTYDAKGVYRTFGYETATVAEDTLLAGYLLNPSASDHQLSQLAVEYLDLALPQEEGPETWARAADAVYRLAPVLRERLQELQMERLYEELELPLAKVLAKMEAAGIKVDKAKLEQMGEQLDDSIERLTREIYDMAGKEFNINSPKQLGEVLFEDLGLPPVKKTKTGYSTNAQVLEELASKHEIVAKILEYRTLMKLKSTYIEGLKPLINPETGKIHTTFNQTITATGRLSSTEPNLQNIPVRLELGRKIRRAFVPSTPDRVLLAADYSQIELRVLAHVSGDTTLKEAFHNQEDIHTRTAAEVFGVPMDQVTQEMRRSAKAVNFGIVYGISDYGLSRDLGISRKQAKNYIDKYFERYHGVKEWIDRVIVRAREEGFVTTLLNRRRYLPDLLNSNWNIRKFGERTAMNTPIQGSAADIIKLAMLAVDRYLEEVPEAEMLLQVHDELIFEVEKDALHSVAAKVKELMEGAYQLDVPLVVDLKAGPDWYHLEPIET